MTTPLSSSSSASSRANAPSSLRFSPEPRVLEVKPSQRPGEIQVAGTIEARRDRVELSERAKLALNTDPAGPAQNIRTDLVERIRAEIEAGTYETPEKLAYAIGRLSGHLDVTA